MSHKKIKIVIIFISAFFYFSHFVQADSGYLKEVLDTNPALYNEALSRSASASKSASISKPLYQNSFSNAQSLSSQGVSALMGTWSVSDKGLTPAKMETRAVFAGTNGSNYDITANVSLNSGNGYGIYYHATDSANITGYCFQVDPGWNNSFIVRKVVNGKESNPFQSVSMADVMPVGFSPKGEHTVSVSVSGSDHVITVDGIQVLKFADSTFTSGFAGARGWGADVNFKNVTVENK